MFLTPTLQDFAAKLSDFGLAKMGPSGEDTHVTTRVMGTHGYAAPEYVMTGDVDYIFQMPLLIIYSSIMCKYCFRSFDDQE